MAHSVEERLGGKETEEGLRGSRVEVAIARYPHLFFSAYVDRKYKHFSEESKSFIYMFVTGSYWWLMTLLRRKERRRRRRLLAKIGSGLQESQIGDGDGEFGIINAQVSLLLLPVDIPC